MTIEDRRGAAYHEAGHVVVAWALGLAVDAGAGREAQSVFGAPTNHLAGAMDEAKIIKLTKHLHEEARSALRNDGYQRAHELIVAHKAKVDRIAENLAAIGSLSQAEIRALLGCPRK